MRGELRSQLINRFTIYFWKGSEVVATLKWRIGILPKTRFNYPNVLKVSKASRLGSSNSFSLVDEKVRRAETFIGFVVRTLMFCQKA